MQITIYRIISSRYFLGSNVGYLDHNILHLIPLETIRSSYALSRMAALQEAADAMVYPRVFWYLVWHCMFAGDIYA